MMEASARITLRTVEALEKLALLFRQWPTTSATSPTLGLSSALLDINNPDADDHDLCWSATRCATPSLMRAPMPH